MVMLLEKNLGLIELDFSEPTYVLRIGNREED